MSILQSIERLAYLLEALPGRLSTISEAEFCQKPSPEQWSKKEILGHLVDSAANNHQRFVRIRYASQPVFFYDQDKWNELSGYNAYETRQLIQFWLSYNLHLLHLIKLIQPEDLERTGSGSDGKRYTLKFYIEDYVMHLEHHLRQIITY